MSIELKSRRELFIDDFIIEEMNGTSLKLHSPSYLRQTNSGGSYDTIINDDDVFRRYYRRYDGSDGKAYYDGNPFEVTCYAESKDGIEWIEPSLGIVEVNGIKDNNVILAEAPCSHNFCPFKDTRPNVSNESRFKALAGTHKDDRSRPAHATPFSEKISGLFSFISSDGIHWKRSSDQPVIKSEQFAFDSQNISFWSEVEQMYVCYFRTWKDNPTFSSKEIESAPYKDFVKYHLRSISRTTSPDYINWSESVSLDPNASGEHLYTSQTHPYFRAPHIYIATPTRFMPDRGNSTDIMFMSSRDGKKFDRTFMESFIRPGLDPSNWGNRSNYVSLNIVPLNKEEIGVYMTGGRLYTLRTDGFASLNSGYNCGEMLTKPFSFIGSRLSINFATSAAGFIKIELLEVNENLLPDVCLAESETLIGDEIDETIEWKRDFDLSSIAKKEIRMRITMRDADVFSFKFKETDE